MHATLAEACLIETDGAESAARHFEAAGDPGSAARAYLLAAEAHCRRHAHANATLRFAKGLRLLSPDTGDEEAIAALQGLARCAALAEESSGRVVLLNDWRLTPPWRNRPAVRIEAALALSALLARGGRHVESAQLRREAARDLAALGRNADAASAAIAATVTLALALHLSARRNRPPKR